MLSVGTNFIEWNKDYESQSSSKSPKMLLYNAITRPIHYVLSIGIYGQSKLEIVNCNQL